MCAWIGVCMGVCMDLCLDVYVDRCAHGCVHRYVSVCVCAQDLCRICIQLCA